MEQHALHPRVATIAKRISFNDGRPCFDPLVYDQVCDDLGLCLESERSTIAEDLLALAFEFSHKGDACKDVSLQLGVLALLVHENRVHQALQHFYRPRNHLSNWLGQSSSKKPIEKTNISQSNSLFSSLVRQLSAKND